jgi:hypothetical protein
MMDRVRPHLPELKHVIYVRPQLKRTPTMPLSSNMGRASILRSKRSIRTR